MIKVATCFSGGIDSTLTSFIINKIGIKNINIYIENNIENEKGECNSEEEIKRCYKITKILKTRIKVINTTKEFKKSVYRKLIERYKEGKSTNPDIICNKKIKFGKVIKKLKKKYKLFAYGHYAKIKKNQLMESIDKKKDQSYFLCKIKNKKKIIMPLANWKKKESINICKFLNLEKKVNKSSRGICFIGNKNFNKFITKKIKSSGKIIEKKKELKEYKNLYHMVIGQRIKTIEGNKERKYIYKKKNNNIYITNKRNSLMYKKNFKISFEYKTKKKIRKVKCKINSRSPKKKCYINKINKRITNISFIYPIKKISEGQYIVIYIKKKCIGGGEIIS